MPQYALTPWKKASELLEVRGQLWRSSSSPALDERRIAADRIDVWTTRGNCPHAVISTGQLMDMVLQEEANTIPPTVLRAAYAGVFSRFVTGFCDIGQNTVSKRTMMDLAETLEMPASFVEIRHEVTHGQLPSLFRLSQHAKMGLAWLWKYYWLKLDEQSTESPHLKRSKVGHDAGVPLSKNDLMNVLSPFRAKRRQEIKARVADAESATSASGQAASHLVGLCGGERSNLYALAEILVSEKMLIPANRSIGDSMDGAYLIWDNLLLRLIVHQRLFLELLSSQMVSILAQSILADARCEAVYEWLGHIFGAHGGLSKDKLDLERVEVACDEVVNQCILIANVFTMRLARKLVDEGSESLQAAYKPLLAMVEEMEMG